jgi:DNA-binding NtrC family response regulator
MSRELFPKNDGARRKVLAADDNSDILETIRLILKTSNFEVDTARSPRAVIAALSSSCYDAVLLDLNYAKDTTSGREGLDLLANISSIDAELPVIVMTAWASVGLAVEAMRNGARDFLEKPFEPSRLRGILETQIQLRRALRRGRILEAEVEGLRRLGSPIVIADSEAMQIVMQMVAKIGPSDANVLVTGEPGTGKEVIAKALHAASLRSTQPLIAVNIGGMPESLFESELFGYVRGAFTDARSDRAGRFELANSGTLFLDEIGNTPLASQAKLLRVLELGELERLGSSHTIKVDVRVISATNSNLKADVSNGRFREDLLYRLNTIEINIPPLRERKEDIPSLAAHFLRVHNARYRKSLTGFDKGAMSALLASPWRGNVRELKHSIERAVIFAASDVVTLADLNIAEHRPAEPRGENQTLEELEEAFIRKALGRHDGNVTLTAKTLGLSRSALYRRLQIYGI